MKKSDDLSILMKLSLVKLPSSPARRITLCAGLDQNVLGWWPWSKCCLIGLGKKTDEQIYIYALVLSLSFTMSSIFRTRITCLSLFYWRQFHVPQRFQSIPTKKWIRSHLCPPWVRLVITNCTIDNIKCDYANALIFRCKSTADLACFKQTDKFVFDVIMVWGWGDNEKCFLVWSKKKSFKHWLGLPWNVCIKRLWHFSKGEGNCDWIQSKLIYTNLDDRKSRCSSFRVHFHPIRINWKCVRGWIKPMQEIQLSTGL